MPNAIQVQVNGQARELPASATVQTLIDALNLTDTRVAVEVNDAIVTRSRHPDHALNDGDQVEIVGAIGGGQPADDASADDAFQVAGQRFDSRLLVGTGKYASMEQAGAAIRASGAQIVTVAIRRSNIGQDPDAPNLLDVIPPEEFTILPNTAGCYTADDALRTCRLARELLDGHTLVKLEVLGDPKTLYPDIPATLEAAKALVADGFDVMVYTSDDPITAKRLEDIGCCAIMPLAAPIGSGLGVQNPYNILTIIENAQVPVLVDAGVGTASDAAIAMELGCDGVLMNTAIAQAKNPVLMASAMRKAIEAGREAFLAGRMPKRRYASASSPLPDPVG